MRTDVQFSEYLPTLRPHQLPNLQGDASGVLSVKHLTAHWGGVQQRITDSWDMLGPSGAVAVHDEGRYLEPRWWVDSCVSRQDADVDTPELALREDITHAEARRLVIGHVRDHPDVYPVDITFALGIPLHVVHEVVEELVSEGVIGRGEPEPIDFDTGLG